MKTPRPPWTLPGVHGPYAHDPTIQTIIVSSPPDRLGRQHFAIIWWCPDYERRRGQHFHAVVDDYVRSSERRSIVLDAFAPGAP